jgi:selenocysteine lyase/cysteine desulfurase
VGTAASLDVIRSVGVPAIHDHNVTLANRCRGALGMAPSDSAIVSVALPDHFDAGRLSGIRAATRAGRLRLCFHLYNTDVDVDRVVRALDG